MTKNELKYYSSLLKKKFRDSEGKFLVEGRKIVQEGLGSNFICERIFVNHDFNSEQQEFLRSLPLNNIQIDILKSQEFSKLTDTGNPQGIAAVFLKPKINREVAAAVDSNFLVALENISDPGNLGTIIRSCDWFGVSELILSKGCADLFSPKTIRSCMGSLFHLKIFEDKDLQSELIDLKRTGFNILCADLEGKNINAFEPPEKFVVIFANEAGGPSQAILNISDDKISVPRKGSAESLNVAGAAAVILNCLTSI